MPRESRRQVRRRARKIRKASRPKATTKDYIQYSLVILVILGILIMAFILTRD